MIGEGKSFKSYLDEFRTVVKDLHDIDVRLDVEDLDIYLLCSYYCLKNTFGRRYITVGRINLSCDDVKYALTWMLIDN